MLISSSVIMYTGSQKYADASRAKKMSPGEEVLGPQGFSVPDTKAAKSKLSGNDLRQYEQLVIMKKYPYLDMKELELKFGPLVKNVKFREGEVADAGECELTDEGPRVEIVNRGISGFAIPKTPKMGENAQNTEHVEMKNVKRANTRVWKNVNNYYH